MKILVRGDVHLDLVSDGISRLEEQEVVLRHTIRAARLLEPDVFVDLGDLFDRPRPSPAAYAAAIEYLEGVHSALPALWDRSFVLAGNHDKTSRGEISALRPLEVLHRATRATRGIARPFVLPEFVDLDGTRLVFLPFVTDWEARQRLGGGKFESAQEYLDDFVRGALLDCERVVAFSHLEVPGARRGDDERVQRDVGTRIPDALLEDARVLRIYAGHVHRYQELDRVTVVGSAIHVDFGESADQKGMIYAEV